MARRLQAYAEQGIQVFPMPLRYDHQGRGREKGVDVRIAIDLTRLGWKGLYLGTARVLALSTPVWVNWLTIYAAWTVPSLRTLGSMPETSKREILDSDFLLCELALGEARHDPAMYDGLDIGLDETVELELYHSMEPVDRKIGWTQTRRCGPVPRLRFRFRVRAQLSLTGVANGM